MTDPKVKLDFTKLEKALIALDAIAFKPIQEDRINIDAAIQRFEFTVELFWKLLKNILQSEGVEVYYPKSVLKEAFQGHLISDETIWLNMLKDRNLTSHTYNEDLADQIYERIKTYIPVLKNSFERLNNNLNK